MPAWVLADGFFSMYAERGNALNLLKQATSTVNFLAFGLSRSTGKIVREK
jgi:hypothetical protein